MKRLIVIFSILYFPLYYAQNTETTRSLLNKMHQSILKYQDLRFTLLRSERDGSEYIKGSFDGKLTMEPFRVYLKNHFPNKGSEILYLEGKNNDKAWVNPNAFPYLTLSLHPENRLLLAGGHHTLKLLGFSVINKMILLYKKNYKEEFFNFTKYLGKVVWKNMNCHKIILNFPDYKIIRYAAKKGETLKTIAENKLLNIAKLKKLNPNIDPKKELNNEQEIIITNAYAKKAIIYLDSKSYLPVVQEIYDEEGVYEKYGYFNLKFGKEIPDEEFSTKYEDYNF